MSANDNLKRVLHPGETIVADAILLYARFAATDRRLAVVTDYRVALDLPYDKIRRIQFDVERSRPATLVIVPEEASAEPQVLAVPHGAIETVARAIGIVGVRLADQ